MTVKVNKILTSFSYMLLVIIIAYGLTQTASLSVFAQSGLVVVIDSDTTWTKADSPHELTGPLFISYGATLTIEAGATVDLNGYDVLVNGTLRAIGSSIQTIHIFSDGRFGNEQIEFCQHSNGWNEQTGSGSIFENVVGEDVSLISSVPLKVSNCDLDGVSICGSSIINGNTLFGISITGGSPTIKNNDIRLVYISGSPVISDNTIERIYNLNDSYADAPVISGNILSNGIGYYYTKDNTFGVTVSYFKAKSPTITNNIVERGIFVTVNSAIIANNTITGYSFPGYEWDTSRGILSVNFTSSGIILDGSGSISGNKISGCNEAIKGGTLIEGNWITNSSVGIVVTKNDAVIRNNNITLQSTGIEALTGGKVTIENNLIKDCDKYGVNVITSEATIFNNTITNIGLVAIRLLECGSAKINYNNIENYAQYSIYLDGTSSTIDATNNWWGTTDTQAIDATIYEFKHDFYLGKVNIEPILTEPNSNAKPEYPPPIPEFSAWTILPLAVGIIFGIIIARKKIQQETAK